MSLLHILYVDDDADIRTIVEMSLSLDPGIKLTVCGSGFEALALVDAELRPDVAVLDLMMPGMDGLELLDALRAREGLAHLPVIFITARGRQRDLDMLTERGALGIIVKPFDPMGLAQQVRSLLASSPPG
jgi:two-component system, OmpR family, response regulator